MQSLTLPFPQPLVPATFVARPNRFVALVRLDGAPAGPAVEPLPAHVPDPGRLHDLLVPGARLWLVAADRHPPGPPLRPGLRRRPPRKTHYDVLLVEWAGELVSLDTRLPLALVRRNLEEQRIPEFAGYSEVRPEVRLGRSRIDFLLSDALGAQCYVEVKSATLVEEGLALFPDAVTERGARHLRELAAARRAGYRAAALFVVQRRAAQALAAHAENDPVFAQALREAAAAGVELVAYTCQLTLTGIALDQRIPVRV